MIQTNLNKLILVLGLTGLNSCQQQAQELKVKFRTVSVFRKRPVGVHEEISPKYYGVLENGDTVPVSVNSRPGDSITYVYRR